MSRTLRFVSILFLPLLAACDASTSAADGTVSIRLTDAPGDFKKAVVTIDRVTLQPGNDSTAQVVVLRDTPITTDLMTLANDVATLVNEAVVPAGTYGQLRFVISGAYIEVEGADGTSQIYATSPSYAGLPSGATVTGNLQTPSFSTSGLKVSLPNGGVTVGAEAQVLLVDFDVSKSFGKQAGNSGQWVMRPSLKATDFQTTGALTATAQLGAGVTMPDTSKKLVNATFVLTGADSSVKTLPVTLNANGSVSTNFRYVVPGTYSLDLKLAGVALTTTPARPQTITVGSGQAATASFTITAATLTP